MYSNTLGIYIHIPFCDGKCNYCDFYSYKAESLEFDTYVEILKNSIDYWSKRLKDKLVDTIYFGGGTPSLLGTRRLIEILKHIINTFRIASNCEITLEANPMSGNLIDFSALKNSGFNRVSLGMQSSIDRELKLLGRRHNKSDVISTVNNIRKSGIENISIDIMLGIPAQTTESLIKSLDFCVSLDIPHISTYLLSVEPETFFGKNREKFVFADDDTQAEFYTITSEYLKDKGFEHYEISNFCRNGMYSRHNMRYWQLKDYLGIGPSAHSLVDSKRFYYPRSMESLISNSYVDDGEGKTPEEYIMLMLRTNMGINTEEYKEIFGKSLSESLIKKVEVYIKHGYIEKDDNSIRLTEKGFLMSNTIIADLI